MSEATTARERDFDRFLTFVDAIVAIAITLLVLPLVEVASGLDRGSVSDLVRDNQNQIWAFLLSFLVIANLWLTQHHVLRNVVIANALILRLMLLWTLTIVALPFPTALLAQENAGHQVTTKLLYVGTMTVSSLVLAFLCLAIGRNDDIRDSPERPDHVRAFATFVTFVVVLGLMLVFPSLSYWPLLLLLAPDVALGKWRRRRKDATAA